MKETILKVTLTLEGPVLTKATTAGRYGIDALVARNESNQPIIPRTLVKGRLRQAWEELHSVAPGDFDPETKDLLGPDPKEGNNTIGSSLDLRGRLRFDDFVFTSTGRKADENCYRHRIKVASSTRAAEERMLRMAEAPFASGLPVEFVGHIRYFAGDAEAPRIQRLIEIGLRWVMHYGGDRTVGFGKLHALKVEKDEASPLPAAVPTPSTIAAGESLFLAIRPTAPFCLAKHHLPQGNLFESETIIPGAALKACVAEIWRQLAGAEPGTAVEAINDAKQAKLKEHFNAVRFTHAFPASAGAGRRPVFPPASLVKGGQDKDGKKIWHDAALFGSAFVFTQPNITGPAFRIDWKESDDVDKDFGWGDPKSALVTRTAINREQQRAAERQLFTYEMVKPEGCEWLARVDFGQVPEADRPEVARQLQELLAVGLRGLGKTKAAAQVEPVTKPPNDKWEVLGSDVKPRAGIWIITLQTHAVLADPSQLVAPEQRTPEKLKEHYADIWKKLSREQLELSHFYATQRLAGGQYVGSRFQAGRAYNPWLLTEAGSVFVLKLASGTEADAVKQVEAWRQHGLPLPDWTRDAYGLKNDPAKPGNDWKLCPYLPENGYGEIAVNLDVHWDHQPPNIQLVMP
jgi:hypothetical protein